jgi:putative FmdB family regulatory protein
MPTYSYQCQKCNENFDIKATLKEKEESPKDKFLCPSCSSFDIKQNFSPIGFLKGISKKDSPCSCCSNHDKCGA